MKFFAYLSKRSGSPSSTKSVVSFDSDDTVKYDHEQKEADDDDQGSVELEDWEIPSFSESGDDGEDKKIESKLKKGSLRVMAPVNRQKEENKQFQELLSFWRNKEKEDQNLRGRSWHW
ncbi:hypothetical protein Tsubulata_031925 [Turnera subulata]|uniref:Uncharacterized protein n=1 Tax=Turnera subulata TaxID=218843 RepID=A0A9Q0FQQ1_9ROSI|nr:hypothetical protein Tsubulata_031925 [Turnera subulata]